MILCITPNPAIDRTLILPALTLGTVHRAQKVIVAAGGKGLNVARTIRILGGVPMCMGFAGGHSGRILAELAENEGLSSSWTWTNAETRNCTILITQDGDATLINEPGMPILASDWKRLYEDVHQQLSAVDLVCISGSLPPNLPAADFQALLSMLVDSGKQVWVDTSGDALKTALAQPGICLKVNGNEIGEAMGFEVTDFDSARRALSILSERDLRTAVITLGAKGALLATREGSWHAEGPKVKVISTAGSGDSFLGGLVTALDAKKTWNEALCHAMAAGAANAGSAGGGQFALDTFQSIRKQIEIQSWRP